MSESVRVFVSYRRSDVRQVAGRLRDRLADAFGEENVFFDVDSIEFGVDFRTVIKETLQSVDAVLAVIGPNFAPAQLAQPNDYVRLELLETLKQGKAVIPILVEDAGMPTADDLPSDLETLSYLNAAPLRPDPDFRRDADRLIESLRRTVGRRGSAISSGSTQGNESNGLVVRESLRHGSVPGVPASPATPPRVTSLATKLAADEKILVGSAYESAELDELLPPLSPFRGGVQAGDLSATNKRLFLVPRGTNLVVQVPWSDLLGMVAWIGPVPMSEAQKNALLRGLPVSPRSWVLYFHRDGRNWANIVLGKNNERADMVMNVVDSQIRAAEESKGIAPPELKVPPWSTEISDRSPFHS